MKTRAETLERIIGSYGDCCDGIDAERAALAVQAWIDAGMQCDPDPPPPTPEELAALLENMSAIEKVFMEHNEIMAGMTFAGCDIGLPDETVRISLPAAQWRKLFGEAT